MISVSAEAQRGPAELWSSLWSLGYNVLRLLLETPRLESQLMYRKQGNAHLSNRVSLQISHFASLSFTLHFVSL